MVLTVPKNRQLALAELAVCDEEYKTTEKRWLEAAQLRGDAMLACKVLGFTDSDIAHVLGVSRYVVTRALTKARRRHPSNGARRG